MKTRLHVQKKVPDHSTHTSIANPFSPRPFGIQAQSEHSSSVQEDMDLEAELEQAMQSGYNLANLPVNAPGTEPPPAIQTKLTIGQPGDRYLAHELTHVVKQRGTAQIQRQPDGDGASATVPVATTFDTWTECYAAMDAIAKKGHDQFVAIHGDAKAIPIRERACKDPASGKYDKAKADSIWSKKAMSDEKFTQELDKKEKADVDSINARLSQIEHLCNETDGTNRPGSVGDGTSEWALLWEAEHGEPFRSPAGHAYKLSDYCKVIKEGLAEIQAKQGSVKDSLLTARIATLVTRATDRYNKMKAALIVWNSRVSMYPSVWNPDGTSKLTPPGSDPLARNQLQAGWPKDATVFVP